MKNNTPNNYAYPVGDFLTGFSDDPKKPCDYELECQRMTIRGVQYFDENPELHDLITIKNQIEIWHPMVKPLKDHMTSGGFGQTGAMVIQSAVHAYHAYRLGWDKYIEEITKP
jgi:hypothetical protein